MVKKISENIILDTCVRQMLYEYINKINYIHISTLYILNSYIITV